MVIVLTVVVYIEKLKTKYAMLEDKLKNIYELQNLF